jgi:hypothetical protein
MFISNQICRGCVIKHNGGIRKLWLYNKDINSIDSDFELAEVKSPIIFNDKKHAFENCSELKLDKERDAFTKTSE